MKDRTRAAAITLAMACLTGTSAAQGPGDESRPLPGYYRWYKRAGEDARLPDEKTRDQAMEQEAGDWAPRSVRFAAPDWSFPRPDGELVPLRVGGEGRNTLVVTFQSWW